MKTKSQEYSSSTRPLLENTPTRENPDHGVNMADTGHVDTSRSKETSPTLQTGQEPHIAAGPPMKVDTPSPFAPEPTSTNAKCIDLSKCYSKHFEEGDDGVPGVHYTSSTGISCWTPVSKGPIPPSSPIRQLILHSKI